MTSNKCHFLLFKKKCLTVFTFMSFQSSRKQIKYKQLNSWWLRFRRVVQKTVKVFNKAGGGHLTGRLPKATHLDSKYNHYIAATPGSEDQNCTYTQGSGTQKPMCGHISAHCCVKNIILVTSFPLKNKQTKRLQDDLIIEFVSFTCCGRKSMCGINPGKQTSAILI